MEEDVSIAANRDPLDGEALRLINSAFAYCFKETRSSNTDGSDEEHINNIGQTSTILRALTPEDGDLKSYFDKNDESEAEIENTSPYHHLINNHDLPVNNGKTKGHLPLEHILGFCRTFKKITKHLRFPLTFKTADIQDIIYTSLVDNSKVNFDKLFLYVSIFISDAQTQIQFKESIENSFTLSIDTWSFGRKTVNTQLEHQVDIGGAQNVNSPKYQTIAHQTAVRVGTREKANNVAVFENLNVRKYHVDNDGIRYPRDGVSIDYATNDYLDRYRDLKLLYREYVGEELNSLFISYSDTKIKYLIQLSDLGFEVDHIILKRIRLSEEYWGPTKSFRLFMKLIRHREIKMIRWS